MSPRLIAVLRLQRRVAAWTASRQDFHDGLRADYVLDPLVRTR